MFGKKKLLKELQELRGAIDDLRREVAFLRGALSEKPVPYSPPMTPAPYSPVSPTVAPWPGTLWPYQYHVTCSDATATGVISFTVLRNDDEQAGPVVARSA